LAIVEYSSVFSKEKDTNTSHEVKRWPINISNKMWSHMYFVKVLLMVNLKLVCAWWLALRNDLDTQDGHMVNWLLAVFGGLNARIYRNFVLFHVKLVCTCWLALKNDLDTQPDRMVDRLLAIFGGVNARICRNLVIFHVELVSPHILIGLAKRSRHPSWSDG
jgi:hypothetical protein